MTPPSKACAAQARYKSLADPTAAASDLEEAEPSPPAAQCRIFLADVHLTRARLFRDRTELAKARELLLDLRARGYHRHDLMLADAEAAATHWPENHRHS